MGRVLWGLGTPAEPGEDVCDAWHSLFKRSRQPLCIEPSNNWRRETERPLQSVEHYTSLNVNVICYNSTCILRTGLFKSTSPSFLASHQQCRAKPCFPFFLVQEECPVLDKWAKIESYEMCTFKTICSIALKISLCQRTIILNPSS